MNCMLRCVIASVVVLAINFTNPNARMVQAQEVDVPASDPAATDVPVSDAAASDTSGSDAAASDTAASDTALPDVFKAEIPEGDADTLTVDEWLERGWGYQRENRKSLAITCFTKAIKLDADCSRAYFSRSEVYEQQDEYTLAEKDLTDFLRVRPNVYSALLNRGLVREYSKKYDAAIQDYSQIQSKDTDFSDSAASADTCRAAALHYRGRVYHMHKQEFQKAIDDYTLSLKLDATTRALPYRRAVAYHELKDYAAADRDFRAGLEKDPRYQNLLRSWAWQLATCPEDKFRDGLLAMRLADRVGDDKALAAANAELGQYDEAIAIQEKLVAVVGLGNRKPEEVKELKDHLKQLQSRKPIRD